jgi:RNA polymerase sigma-70 factor (ECF subfamily)
LPEDDDLARAARAGSLAAFGAIVERHGPALVRYCERRTRHRQRGEDLAQDALVAAWAGLWGWDPVRPFVPWLYGVAENVVRMDARRRRWSEVSRDRLLDERGELAFAAETDVAEGVVLRDAVQRALDRLGDKDQAALLLARMAGFSMREVGQALGVSEAAAKQRVHRAGQRFAAHYTDPHGDAAQAPAAGDSPPANSPE